MRLGISKPSIEGNNKLYVTLCFPFIFPGGGLGRKLSELCRRARDRKNYVFSLFR